MQNLAVDLLLNLLAEGIGILVTVLLIDQILKHREAKKWLPAKHYAHAHLMAELDKFLSYTIGSILEHEASGALVIHKFGSASVLGPASYKDKDGIDAAFELRLRLKLKSDMQQVLKKRFDIEPMKQLSTNIKNSMVTSHHLFSPELSAYLIELDNQISEYSPQLDYVNFDKDEVKRSFQIVMYRIIKLSIDARLCVEKEADKIISTDEAKTELIRKLEDNIKYVERLISTK